MNTYIYNIYTCVCVYGNAYLHVQDCYHWHSAFYSTTKINIGISISIGIHIAMSISISFRVFFFRHNLQLVRCLRS